MPGSNFKAFFEIVGTWVGREKTGSYQRFLSQPGAS